MLGKRRRFIGGLILNPSAKDSVNWVNTSLGWELQLKIYGIYTGAEDDASVMSDNLAL